VIISPGQADAGCSMPMYRVNDMKKNRYSRIMFLWVPLLLCCCQTPHVAQNISTAEPSSPVILFISLKVWHDTVNDAYRVGLVNVKHVQGTFKEVSSDADTSNYPDYLVCAFTTKEGTVLKSLVSEHPLFRRFEYETKEGRLTSKTVALDSARFTLRTLCPAGLSILTVSQVLHKSKPEKLGSFNITCNENDH
jgi:hypothetical protein